MLRKRIIFTLIYSQNQFTQSRNFRLQKVGNIDWLKKHYQLQKTSFSLDELIVLNGTREQKNINDFANIISQLTDSVFIPVAAGGGIRSLEDAQLLFNSGADKIVLNSALCCDIHLVKSLLHKYGSQSIIASIDYRIHNKLHEIYIADGSKKLDMTLINYIQHIENLGLGEVYLNSIDQDGTGFGYDFKTIEEIKDEIKIPLIIAGGAGNAKHLCDGLNIENVSAVATANLFNFIGNGFSNARREILDSGINIAPWACD